MSAARRAAAVACALPALASCAGLPQAAAPGTRCELLLAEHRSGRELARLPLDAAQPSAQVAFTHSVLGTPVADRYVWRRGGDEQGGGDAWRAHLVEERYEGEGYGLPNAAGPGETLVRDGAGWRLQLDRVVHPLVVLPLPSQRMRVQAGEAPALLLGDLSRTSIEMTIQGCAVR